MHTKLIRCALCSLAFIATAHAQITYLVNTSTVRISDNGNGVPGLVDVESVLVAPDGRHVHTADHGAVSLEDALTAFTSNIFDGSTSISSLRTASSAGSAGLDMPEDMAISPDGLHMYVMSFADSRVSHWTRMQSNGFLAKSDLLTNNLSGVSGIGGPIGGAVSPDGKHLYVIGQTDNAVAAIALAPTTGTQTFIASLSNMSPGNPPITTPSDVIVSPDGSHVYVSSFGDNAIAVFDRDQDAGGLTFLSFVQQGAGGVTTMIAPEEMAISPDGEHLYVTASGSNALTIFSRDAVTGSLTRIGAMQDGVDDVDGLGGAGGIAIGPKGIFVYACGETDDLVAVFTRDPSTGLVEFIHGAEFSLGGGPQVTVEPSSVAVHPTGQFVYVTGREADALFTFEVLTVSALSGYVYEKLGDDIFLPVSCASVEIRDDEGAVFTAVTDITGFYEFPLVPIGFYDVRINGQGYGETIFADKLIDPFDLQARFFNFVVDRETDPPDVAGEVTDDDTGEPLVGVLVTLDSDGNDLASTYTCATGAYELFVPTTKGPSNLTLRFELANYDTEMQNIVLPPDETLNVNQPMTKSVGFPGSLTGMVLSTADSSAIPGATVTLRGPANVSTTTDNDGVYSFDVLDGSYQIRGSKEGFLGATLNRAIAGGSTQIATLRLAPDSGNPADVSGDGQVNAVDIQLVINRVLGQPIAGNADVNSDGQVNSVDIQLVINAVLGVG